MDDIEGLLIGGAALAVAYLAWMAYQSQQKILNAASTATHEVTAAATQAVGTVQGAATGTVGAATVQTMDAGKYGDMIRAGATPAQAAASVAEVNAQIPPALTVGQMISNAVDYWTK